MCARRSTGIWHVQGADLDSDDADIGGHLCERPYDVVQRQEAFACNEQRRQRSRGMHRGLRAAVERASGGDGFRRRRFGGSGVGRLSSGDNFGGECFVRGQCRHTSNCGAGYRARHDTPPPPKPSVPCGARKHSRRRPTSHSHARKMNGRDKQTNCRQQRNNTCLPPPLRMRKKQEVPQDAQKISREKFRH